jgi:hypothetical protein
MVHHQELVALAEHLHTAAVTLLIQANRLSSKRLEPTPRSQVL